MSTVKKRVKVKEYENLSDSNIEKVISLLESQKPITKKEACEILNISYNTTRLATIIENYKSRKAYEKTRKEQNRGKPASQDELQSIIQMYLQGTSVADIARDLFRSPAFVKGTVDRFGVPTKLPYEQRVKPAILPDECIAETFNPGQYAWSAVYHGPCEIVSEVTNIDYLQKYNSRCYKIYVYEPIDEIIDLYPNIKKGGYYAFSLAYNLGSLEHLIQYGIKL